MAMEKVFNSEVIIQTDKYTPIQSIYCFGKNHRPDMTLGENGIAIELKSITCAGQTEMHAVQAPQAVS